jgi:electron transfer flavoprotein beta subunit
MSISGIIRGANADIKVWGAADIAIDLSMVGLKASPTNVFKSFTPKPKGKGVVVEGDTAREIAGNLLENMKEKHLI